MITTGHDSSGTLIEIANITSLEIARDAGFYNADSPVLIYEGLWQASTLAGHCGELAHFSTQENASVTFTFEGIGFRWLGYSGRTQGFVDIYVDGQHVAEIDTYQHDPAFQQTLFELQDMDAGQHTVTIVVKGQSIPAAEDQRIHIDGIEILNN